LNRFFGSASGLRDGSAGYRPGGMRVRGAVAVVLALLLGALFAVPAQAGEVVFAPQDNANPTANDGWQAGTCKIDIPTCSVDTPPQFFETAAGHPPVGFTQFIVRHTTVLGHEEPEVDM